MLILLIFHVINIFWTLIHIFYVDTVNSENSSCLFVWPLMHMFYCFINFLFCWFYFFIFNELSIKNSQIINFSKKILIFILIFSFQSPILKILTDKCCKSWTINWRNVIYQLNHLVLEIFFIFLYLNWFEKKYTNMKKILKESCLMK